MWSQALHALTLVCIKRSCLHALCWYGMSWHVYCRGVVLAAVQLNCTCALFSAVSTLEFVNIGRHSQGLAEISETHEGLWPPTVFRKLMPSAHHAGSSQKTAWKASVVGVALFENYVRVDKVRDKVPVGPGFMWACMLPPANQANRALIILIGRRKTPITFPI